METITYLAALTLALSAPGKTASPIIGTWHAQVSQEMRQVARKMGLPEPRAEFVFRDDNTFSYTSPGKSFTGTYEFSEHSLRLNPSQDADWEGTISGELKTNSELDLDGLKYTKTSELAGTWTLRTANGEDSNTRFVFKEDGWFEFSGQSATSKGKFHLDGDQLTLDWSEIDGEKVELGTVRKTITFRGDGLLQIDNYRYAKL